jgi:hypothetical protein
VHFSRRRGVRRRGEEERVEKLGKDADSNRRAPGRRRRQQQRLDSTTNVQQLEAGVSLPSSSSLPRTFLFPTDFSLRRRSVGLSPTNRARHLAPLPSRCATRDSPSSLQHLRPEQNEADRGKTRFTSAMKSKMNSTITLPNVGLAVGRPFASVTAVAVFSSRFTRTVIFPSFHLARTHISGAG